MADKHLTVTALHEWLTDTWRNNRDAVWFQLRRWSMLHQRYLSLFLLFHLVGLISPWRILDFVCAIGSMWAGVMALVQYAKVVEVLSLLVDSLEGIPHFLSSLARFVEGIIPGGASGVATPTDLKTVGFDKVKGANRLIVIYGSLFLSANLFYWCLIWQSHLSGFQIGFSFRFMIVLLILWIGTIVGVKNSPIPLWVLNTVQVGAVVWLGLILLQVFGAFTWLGRTLTRPGYRLPPMKPPETLVGVTPLLFWAFLFLALAGILGKMRLRSVAFVVAGIGVLLVIGAALEAWKKNKDTVVADVVPTKIVEALKEAQVKAEANRPATPTEVNALVSAAPELKWHLRNCLGIRSPYTLYLVEQMGEGRKHFVLDSYIEPGETKDLTNSVPAGWALRVVAWDPPAGQFYPYDLDLVGNRKRKSEIETQNPLDPENKWKNITEITPDGPLFSFACPNPPKAKAWDKADQPKIKKSNERIVMVAL